MAKAKSRSKKKKSGSSVKKTKPEDVSEIPVDGEAEDELSAGEKFLIASKPYWAHILLGVLSIVFATVLWSAWSNISSETASQPWRDLNNAMTQADLTRDISSLKEMAVENEGNAAAHWALLMAGDREVNSGISMLASDRVGGRKLIEKGADSLQQVVDAPAASKSPMLQRRSMFMLANAREALGEFDIAKSHYQALLDAAPESPFADVSRRGLARCSNPELKEIYEKFRNWEEAADVAPGPLVPEIPKLNIDEIKLPEGEPETFGSGGEFGGEMKAAEPKSDESDQPQTESETKPDPPADTEQPAKEQPATEMPKEEAAVDAKSAEPEAADTKAEPTVEEKPAVEADPELEKAEPKSETPKSEAPKAEPEEPTAEAETSEDP